MVLVMVVVEKEVKAHQERCEGVVAAMEEEQAWSHAGELARWVEGGGIDRGYGAYKCASILLEFGMFFCDTMVHNVEV